MKDREHREKILLVENNIEVAKFIIDNLENNYEIIQSHSGKDAIEVIKNEDFGIVLIDIIVQELDVFGLIENIRLKSSAHYTPIVLIIDPVELSDNEALKLKVDDFIAKPIKKIELISRVRSMLRLKYFQDEYYSMSTLKSQILANMSHELRTPMNTIIGFSDILKQKMVGELNETQERYMDNILNSSKHLLSLINDILDLSKIESGQIEMNIEKISLPSMINDTLEMVKTTAIKHNINLIKQLDPQLDLIEADRRRIQQILFNLLSNAVKFSKKEGGIITITTKKEGGLAKISVSDTGIGIKHEHMEKLFMSFETPPEISNRYGGTGFGLSISKALVEGHGGTIVAQSKYGEGSTFTFFIPLKR